MRFCNQHFLRLLVLLLAALHLLPSAQGVESILCVDANGSFTVESADSPCCGRCCLKTHPACPAETSLSRLPDATTDDCLDIALPGHSIISAAARTPSFKAPTSLAELPILMILPQLTPILPDGLVHARHDHRAAAGIARIAQLETIVIRC